MKRSISTALILLHTGPLGVEGHASPLGEHGCRLSDIKGHGVEIELHLGLDQAQVASPSKSIPALQRPEALLPLNLSRLMILFLMIAALVKVRFLAERHMMPS